jgi:hypothetical protein
MGCNQTKNADVQQSQERQRDPVVAQPAPQVRSVVIASAQQK